MARNKDFVDKGIRFTCSVPTEMLERYKFMTRKGISPNVEMKKKMRELTKAERIKFGIDQENDKKSTARKPMLKDYLKLPLSHANHPV